MIRITITKTANKQSLPFDEILNEETIIALEESKRDIGVHMAKDIDDLCAHKEFSHE